MFPLFKLEFSVFPIVQLLWCLIYSDFEWFLISCKITYCMKVISRIVRKRVTKVKFFTPWFCWYLLHLLIWSDLIWTIYYFGNIIILRGGVPARGCTCLGVYLSGGVCVSQHAMGQASPLWTEWLTDRCKNITFANFVCSGNKWFLFGISYICFLFGISYICLSEVYRNQQGVPNG